MLTRTEQSIGILLQQIAHGIFDIVNSIVINYVTGDVTVSIASATAAQLQAANQKIAYVGLTVSNAAKTATVHAPALATAAQNLTAQNITNLQELLVTELGYTISVNTGAKTVTLGWDNGT